MWTCRTQIWHKVEISVWESKVALPLHQPVKVKFRLVGNNKNLLHAHTRTHTHVRPTGNQVTDHLHHHPATSASEVASLSGSRACEWRRCPGNRATLLDTQCLPVASWLAGHAWLARGKVSHSESLRLHCLLIYCSLSGAGKQGSGDGGVLNVAVAPQRRWKPKRKVGNRATGATQINLYLLKKKETFILWLTFIHRQSVELSKSILHSFKTPSTKNCSPWNWPFVTSHRALRTSPG